jgi:hypothetical protein
VAHVRNLRLLGVSVNDFSVPKSRGKVPFETQDAYDNHLIQLFSRTFDTKTGTPTPPVL